VGAVTTSESESRVPLARLLAVAYRLLIDGLHDRLLAAGWTDVRPAFGFVLLAARSEPTTSTALAQLMGTTKQATSKLIDVMEAGGYVSRQIDAVDARQRSVVLTKRGEQLLHAVEEIYRDLEAEWATVVGAQNVERLRATLRIAVSQDDGSLPPIRPTW
jgi:DNA-binding MarR family transcriptional regulator